MLHIVFTALLLLMAGCGGSGMTTAMVEPPVVMPPVVAPPEEPTEKPVESPVEPPVVMPPVELPEETNTPEPISPDAPTLVERLSFPLQAWSDPMAFSTQHYGIERVPEQDIAMAQHMPIYHDDSCHAETGACLPLFPTAPERRLFVGVDQGVEHIGNLPSTGERGDIEVRYGNLNDGAGRAMVQDYLVDAEVARYFTSPEVRLIGPASASDLNHLVNAVQIVNTALPIEVKMRMGASLPDLSLKDTVNLGGLSEQSDGTIYVEYVPVEAFPNNAGGTTRNIIQATGDGEEQREEVAKSYIRFNKGATVYGEDRRAVMLLAHELIHALGVSSHVSPNFDTIMDSSVGGYTTSQRTPQPLSLLYPVDREALRVLYSRLNNANEPTSIGPWANTSME